MPNVHRFPCPSCGKTLKIDDVMLAEVRRRGKGTHCPTCKAPVSVAGVGASLELAPVGRLNLRLPLTEPDTALPPVETFPDPTEPLPAAETATEFAPDDDEEEPRSLGGQPRRGRSGVPLGVAGLVACVASLALAAGGFFTHGLLFAPAAGLALLGLFLGLASRGALRVLAATAAAVLLVFAGGLFVLALWGRAVGNDFFDPDAEVTRIGNVTVQLRSAAVGPVRLGEFDRWGDTAKSYLSVRITVANDSRTRRVPYAGWGASGAGPGESPRLEDEHGNTYRAVHFGLFAKVSGQAPAGGVIDPGQEVSDLLVFETPIPNASRLRLRLPGRAVEQAGEFRLTFQRP